MIQSWKEVEKLAKLKEELAAEVERLSEEISQTMKKLEDVNLEQFKAAPKTDTLFGYSPIAQLRIVHDFKRHLMKVGCPSEPLHPNPVEIPAFSETIRLGNAWVLKLKPTKSKQTDSLL